MENVEDMGSGGGGKDTDRVDVEDSRCFRVISHLGRIAGDDHKVVKFARVIAQQVRPEKRIQLEPRIGRGDIRPRRLRSRQQTCRIVSVASLRCMSSASAELDMRTVARGPSAMLSTWEEEREASWERKRQVEEEAG
eukprot:752341-Hanusia_phi.AAC.2